MNKFPYKLIDLTHTLSEESPSWSGESGFNRTLELDYDASDSQVKFRVQRVKMDAGIGTHIDCPSHCLPGAATVEKLPLDHLIAPLVVIDVHEKITADYKISDDEIIGFENEYGRIQENSFVAFYTGWSRHWNNPKQYRNNHSFPSMSESAAHLLISRNVTGIGIDTLSPDLPTSRFPVHKIILGAGKYIVENVHNLEK
ncbi:MAG: cyclase family protein, partial [Chlamydiota bacterium]